MTDRNGWRHTGRRRTDGAPVLLEVQRFLQPDDLTCGPTCLMQVYRYFGYEKGLAEVIAETPRNPDGGTLTVYLGLSAQQNGFMPTIYSYNLRVFDPTWSKLKRTALVHRLEKRLHVTESVRLRRTLQAYIAFLERGGRVRFPNLEKGLLVKLLRRGTPILCGLSATYLYRCKREFESRYNDIQGDPVGHFVVVCGYYPRSDRFVVRDPAMHIPFSRSGRYTVDAERLIAAILLGDVTYDADLLVLDSKSKKRS